MSKLIEEQTGLSNEMRGVSPDFSQITESKLDPVYAAGYSDGLHQGEQMQAAHVVDLERKIALVMAHDSNLIDGLERLAKQK